ncbi:MAG: flagellar biosynthesis protein FlhF [Rhodocyclaceae bacterium]|jgi:flagellar biosynthesis protein FlhF|nr:flagellar biosynthesis protein FlhF [Rhodocyclaceae bacterium]
MNVKRYFGKTAREALRELKAELGADAIVLSNRAVSGGVEIIALPAEAVGVLQSGQSGAAATGRASAQPVASTPRAKPVEPRQPLVMDEADDDDYRISLSASRSALRDQVPRDDERLSGAAAARPVIRPFQPPRVETADYLMRQKPYPDEVRISRPTPDAAFDAPAPDHEAERQREAQARAARAKAEAEARRQQEQERAQRDEARIQALQEANTRLMEELGSIRGMIERQLAGFAWGETRKKAPARAEIVGELLQAGFATQLARQLAESVGDESSMDEARAMVRQCLARDLRAMSSDDDLIEQGGIYALVGPTGVGKTTTTAKIAARFVVRHGAERLALITTDGYRIGAQEQLRIYGRILGVPVFPVRDAYELRQTLSELRNKQMVLIDTVGMSQHDRMVAQQAAMLSGAGTVRRLLLLNATCRGDTLDDVIKAYRGPDLAGCIFSKVDEAASLAPAISAAISHELDVYYVTNGQRVPEDLHLPNRSYLLHRALRAHGEDSPWQLQGDEAALMMAAGMER